MKLSKRLQQLTQMVGQEYSHIWDCCCDHGQLGVQLLTHTDARIHFVDIVPELITRLTGKLEQHCADRSDRWRTYCMDVAELPLDQEQGKQLIIIAGVGGDLLIQFLDALMQKNPDLDADFLLCPVYHQYAVRQKLIGLNFSLLDEVLIEDNKRFYEALLVSSNSDSGESVSSVGEKIWQSDSEKEREIARRYLTRTLGHYRRNTKRGNKDTDSTIQAYSTVKL